MTSMLESLRGLASPAILSITTRQTNESESAIAKGFGAAIPAIAASIATRCDDRQFMKDLTNLATKTAEDPDPLFGIVRLVSPAANVDTTTATGAWVARLFGDNLTGVLDTIANYAGIRRSSAAPILSISTPLVLGYLGRLMHSEELSPDDLANRLRGQRAHFAAALPSEFQLPEVQNEVPVPAKEDGMSPGSAYIFHQPLATSWTAAQTALLCLLGVGSLVWWLGRTPTKQVARVDVTEVVKAIGTTGNLARPTNKPKPVGTTGVGTTGTIGARFTRTLPGNVVVTIPRGSAEDRLSAFLASAGGGGTTMTFDRVAFDSGSAALTAQAREQVDTVAEILRVYPNARVTVAGYSDNRGSEAANMSLSRARAKAVASRLTAGGVPSQRVQAEGYGSQKPVNGNATETGRAQNRRVTLEVTAR